MVKTGSKPIDELIRRAIIGDGTAFAKLWDNNADSLRLYIRGKFPGLDDFYIDDVVSRSFEKAFRQIGNYDPAVSKFSTWLQVIARNTAFDICERLKRETKTLISIDGVAAEGTDFKEEYPDTGSDSSLEAIIKEEEEIKIHRYVEALPETYRSVARKRIIEGLKYQEISEETGIALNTVRTKIRRAKDIIDRMKKDEEE